MIDFSWIRVIYPPEFILDFLNTPILGLVPILDYWLIVHFISGFILGSLLRKLNFFFLLAILVFFEIFEYILFMQGLARYEGALGILLDIVVGLAGCYVAKFIWWAVKK